ncbi:MAG: hypothetical protein AAF721_34565, partial [Myxococcota bacterium]
CINSTGITPNMYSATKARCTNPQAQVGCSSSQPWNLTPAWMLDLTTDVMSTANLYAGCAQEMDNNVGPGC